MQSNPEFVAEQRWWLGAYQAGSARKYFAERRKNDPSFKLLQNLRGRINSALKGAGKSKGTMHLIGCPIAELKAHLEKPVRSRNDVVRTTVSGTSTISCHAAHSTFVALTINTDVFTLPISSLFGPTTILRRAAHTESVIIHLSYRAASRIGREAP